MQLKYFRHCGASNDVVFVWAENKWFELLIFSWKSGKYRLRKLNRPSLCELHFLLTNNDWKLRIKRIIITSHTPLCFSFFNPRYLYTISTIHFYRQSEFSNNCSNFYWIFFEQTGNVKDNKLIWNGFVFEFIE